MRLSRGLGLVHQQLRARVRLLRQQLEARVHMRLVLRQNTPRTYLPGVLLPILCNGRASGLPERTRVTYGAKGQRGTEGFRSDG